MIDCAICLGQVEEPGDTCSHCGWTHDPRLENKSIHLPSHVNRGRSISEARDTFLKEIDRKLRKKHPHGYRDPG